MPCLCAPTTHAGSFRCRLHRTNSWGGRSTRPTHGPDLEISTASLIENSLQKEQQKQDVKKAAASAPLPPRSPSARSPPKGSSRLRNVVSSSDEEDEVIKPSGPVSSGQSKERMPTMKMTTGTSGSFSSAPGGGRAAMFRMMKTGQSTSEIFL